MARCDQCGNEYHAPMQIELRGESYIFDSFECAIAKLAPLCAHCGTRVVGHGLQGHGLQGKDEIYCCGHCAEQAGVKASA